MVTNTPQKLERGQWREVFTTLKNGRDSAFRICSGGSPIDATGTDGSVAPRHCHTFKHEEDYFMVFQSISGGSPIDATFKHEEDYFMVCTAAITRGTMQGEYFCAICTGG
eukprot:CAMPEP_0172518966 /NCGR_PEP_ID=MMETSP1066-20121228/291134_1 /TAXON_ID=671091 /ORGANISM="Coscinodiscus wailesii, Strain CCMP2513" /LENGTH=109 /DNA_ID=CAMNT_0013301459 /DNA_START=249 /DNA_END=579 /DNA_ORIENTATION=-